MINNYQPYGYPQFYNNAPQYQPQLNYQQQQPQNTNVAAVSSLSGRYVNTVEDIRPAEVPMDGSVGLFPTNDGTKIYAKVWASDGTIRTVTYLAAPENKPEADTRIDDILTRLEKVERQLSKKNRDKDKEKVNTSD